jgi:hypothetical protein
MHATKDVDARSGFAVSGTSRDALNGVYEVLVEDREPQNVFRAGTEISIVFFSHPSQPHVGIDRVERRGGNVEIQYVLASHGLSSVTWHLSLIPLGKLPPGHYRVEMLRTANNQRFNQHGFPSIDSTWDRFIICGPFSFKVVDEK